MKLSPELQDTIKMFCSLCQETQYLLFSLHVLFHSQGGEEYTCNDVCWRSAAHALWKGCQGPSLWRRMLACYLEPWDQLSPSGHISLFHLELQKTQAPPQINLSSPVISSSLISSSGAQLPSTPLLPNQGNRLSQTLIQQHTTFSTVQPALITLLHFHY